MSIFASRTTKTIPIPFDPPHTVTIMKLTGRTLAKADREADFAAQEYVTRMGGAAFRQQLEEATKNTADAAIKAAQRNPLNAFDRTVLLHGGVKAWTYVEDDGTPIPVTPATIDDLDPEAGDFFAEQILRLTKPSLFLSYDEAAADQKEAQAAVPGPAGTAAASA
jgi:hypothetical protein